MLAALTLQLLHSRPGCQNVFAHSGHASCLLQHSSGLLGAAANACHWPNLALPRCGDPAPFPAILRGSLMSFVVTATSVKEKKGKYDPHGCCGSNKGTGTNSP